MAFMNVDKDLFSILKKGSRTGKRSEPHSVTCSRMWQIPVESAGTVLKLTEKALISSSA